MEVPIVVDTQWLSEHLTDENVVPVDVRAPAFYAQAHLPGAVSFPGFFLSGPAGGPPPATAFADRLGALGIDNQTHIVAYDEGGSPAAARLYWVLRYFGHEAVSVLEGGITAWRHAGYDWEYATINREPATYTASEPNESLRADESEVRRAIDDPGSVILDVRSPAEYLGLRSTATRNGHIPGALNIDWSANLAPGEDGLPHLLDDETLREFYRSAGVTPDKTVVVHCQSGGRSSYTFMVLQYLGYPTVKNYDAGWAEWGNSADAPIDEA